MKRALSKKGVIKAQWYAADLNEYCERRELSILSTHDKVINFEVEGWPHLLIVADQSLEKGPATIGIGSTEFQALSKMTGSITTGSYEPGILTVHSNNRGKTIAVNWRDGKSISFAAYFAAPFDHFKASVAVDYYFHLLKIIDIPTASAVLLGRPGGEEYFRQQIQKHIPPLIKSLIKQKGQDFLQNCRNIIGMGRGLTPTGDDLIHGALIANHCFSLDKNFIRQIDNDFSRQAANTNKYGRHMLEVGKKGLTPLALKGFFETIAEGSPSPEALERLTAIGSGTGFDLAVAAIYFSTVFKNERFDG
jgi:hypothetical protein